MVLDLPHHKIREAAFMPSPRVLLLRCDRLGDCMLALPAAVTLRALLPDAHISFCCRPENVPLVSLVDGIDEVIAWDPDSGTASLGETFKSFDAAAMLLPKPPSLAWALWRSGVKIRVGSGRRWWSPLFSHRVAGSRSAGVLHESQQNTRLAIALAQALGATAAPQPTEQLLPSFTFPEAVTNQAHDTIAAAGLDGEGPLVILHGGSRGSAKDWPLEHMVELANHLIADGCQVGWTVGPVDAAVQQRIAESLGDTAHFIVAPPLDVLAAVLSQAHCVVANSTGPLHVASLAGAPVVGLYPPVKACTPDRWGPIGPGARSLTAPLQPGESNPIPKPDLAPDDLMTRISVEKVYALVQTQLERYKSGGLVS